MDVFTAEQLSPKIWKIVENDPFKQYPFLYVILGTDKCILIDTGCGTSDYFSFLNSKVNTNKLPYLVICTHVHFDHVGGNFQFTGSSCLGICMGGQNKIFTQNYEINSLAMAHSGARVKEFAVTRWLNEGDLIYLDEKDQSKQNSLEVIFTPGHTPDSIALFARWDNRIFVGDTIYPFTAIHLDCLGSSVDDFKSTLKKLTNFISGTQSNVSPVESNLQKQTVTSLSIAQKKTITDFCNTLGLTKESLNFSLETLMELCDWSLEETVNFYLSNFDNIQSLCPPTNFSQKSSSPLNSKIVISCGHVEANLGVDTLQKLLDMLEFIQLGALPPAYQDGEYGEFSNDNFTLMLPMKHTK